MPKIQQDTPLSLFWLEKLQNVKILSANKETHVAIRV
jgi:hypothetical protein